MFNASSVSTTFSVTAAGSDGMRLTPRRGTIDACRQYSAEQDIRETAAQFTRGCIGVALAQAAQRQIPDGALHLSHQFHFAPGWSVAREIEQYALNIRGSIGESLHHTECISRFTIS